MSHRKRLGFAALFGISLYVMAYVGLRISSLEPSEHDGREYVIFGSSSSYYFFRPISYVDAALTGMNFHIGPHVAAPVSPIIVFPIGSQECANRIVGTWRSDASISMTYNRTYARLEPRQDEFLASLMGKMTMTFSGQQFHLRMPKTTVSVQGELREFDGFEKAGPYQVVACGTNNIAITMGKEGSLDLATYYFTSDRQMWTYGGGADPKLPDLHIREYFERVP